MVDRNKVHKELVGELRGQIKKHTSGRMGSGGIKDMSDSEEEATSGPGGNFADTHSAGNENAGSDGAADMTSADDSDVEGAIAECKSCGADVGSKFCGECGTPRGGGEEAEAEFEE